jgi:hypothetical protein
MANDAKTLGKLATPTLEQFKSVANSVVEVGNTATAIPAANMAYRKGLFIFNAEATGTYVYIGTSTVTADETAGTGGYKLDGGLHMFLTLDGSCTLYAIAAVAATVHILEVA